MYYYAFLNLKWMELMAWISKQGTRKLSALNINLQKQSRYVNSAAGDSKSYNCPVQCWKKIQISLWYFIRQWESDWIPMLSVALIFTDYACMYIQLKPLWNKITYTKTVQHFYLWIVFVICFMLNRKRIRTWFHKLFDFMDIHFYKIVIHSKRQKIKEL